MSVELMIILKDDIIAYAKGQLNSHEEKLVEELIRTDERAKLIYDSVMNEQMEPDRRKTDEQQS